MTKEAQNQIIKDAWVRNLQKEGDIPESRYMKTGFYL